MSNWANGRVAGPYAWLLRLLPRHRRARHGDEMRVAFSRVLEDAGHAGTRAVTRVWIREVVGMLKFGSRERLGAWLPLGSPRFNDLRWAWRGVRSRGWRAVFIIGLFGVALAANAIVFAAADTFVFRTVPYADPEQLVVFHRASSFFGASDYTNRDPIFEWRKHEDLFSGLAAHEGGASVYLTEDGITEVVRSHSVTPGLFELLGVLPAHGRPFVASDAEPGSPPFVILSHELAKRLFGSPAAALERTIEALADKPIVVGVMPPDFRFPSAVEQLWRPMDLSQIRSNFGVRAVARLKPSWTVDTAAAAYLQRLPSVAASLPEDSRRALNSRIDDKELSLISLASFLRHQGVTTIFAMLLGAAGCLLLIACANVASLELAASATRTRTLAVQTALGASRGSLVRIMLLEGGMLLVASVSLAIALSSWGLEALAAQLTVAMRNALANPLDVDARLIGFMTGVAALTWSLTTLPSLIQVSRLSVVAGLRHDSRTMPVSKGAAASRQWLMTAQVALTVLLLVAALLYIRSYEHRVGLDKGLDASNVATVVVSAAPDANREPNALSDEVIERLRSLPWVRAATRVSLLPPSTQAGVSGPLQVRGRSDDLGSPMVSFNNVDPEYFKVMSIVAIEGRLFDATTQPDQIVIDEKFARKFWPSGSAVGARFNVGTTGIAGVREFEVIGVSRGIRADRVATEGGMEVFVAYFRLSPKYRPLNFAVKTDGPPRLDLLADAVRSIGPRLLVRTDTVEARYRRLEEDNRLAATITSGFGTVAWMVAAAGVYAVMAFLVAGRTREIGIRMALGADRSTVRAMVLRDALRFVVIGSAIGLVAAAGAAQWIESRLFGVSPVDPVTYASVLGLVLLSALFATWLPARRAAQIDPAITLRQD